MLEFNPLTQKVENMTISSFLTLLLYAYLAGLAGSLLASARQIDEMPDEGGAIFLLVLLFGVITYVPLQIAKIATAILSTYLLWDYSYHGLKTCALCFALGFILISLLPALSRNWPKLKAFVGKLLSKFTQKKS
ncbi:MAG: hypothetical protein K2X27_03175 [Candidatus Obscuribacterales bacterium]|nr:hypothetical protein [Candidatus Obscuribacterales bacterium]